MDGSSQVSGEPAIDTGLPGTPVGENYSDSLDHTKPGRWFREEYPHGWVIILENRWWRVGHTTKHLKVLRKRPTVPKGLPLP